MKMPRKRTPKGPTKRRGPATKYRGEFVQQVRVMAEAGALDIEIAGLLKIALRTLYYWKAQHPDFAAALCRGKDVADDAVEAALFRRATGYSFDSVKIVTVPMGAGLGSEVREVPVVEHVPPDTAAATFWLKNRRPTKWRDRQEVEHSGTLTLGDLVEAARKLPPVTP